MNFNFTSWFEYHSWADLEGGGRKALNSWIISEKAYLAKSPYYNVQIFIIIPILPTCLFTYLFSSYTVEICDRQYFCITNLKDVSSTYFSTDIWTVLIVSISQNLPAQKVGIFVDLKTYFCLDYSCCRVISPRNLHITHKWRGITLKWSGHDGIHKKL